MCDKKVIKSCIQVISKLFQAFEQLPLELQCLKRLHVGGARVTFLELHIPASIRESTTVSGQHSSQIGVAVVPVLQFKAVVSASGANSGFQQCLSVLEKVRPNITGAPNATVVEKYCHSCRFMKEKRGQQLTLQNASS